MAERKRKFQKSAEGRLGLNKENTSDGFILKMAFYHQKYHPSIYSVVQQNHPMQLLTAFTENEEIYPFLFWPTNRRRQQEKRGRPNGSEVASVQLDPDKPQVGQARPDTIISQPGAWETTMPRPRRL